MTITPRELAHTVRSLRPDRPSAIDYVRQRIRFFERRQSAPRHLATLREALRLLERRPEEFD